MIWLEIIIGWCVVVANFTLIWVMVCKIRDANQREESAMMSQIEAIECAELLRQIAVQSCMTHHLPVWQAWADTMGDIAVDVKSRMHRFDGC